MALTIRTVVRDPVHGDIGLTREELAILDTPEMQRLRGVRQLGTAYLVYPGAQHSRFEHSLGTMHLVQAMTDAINRNRALAPGELIGIADDELRILRAAALVHDLTHIPFGHGIEDASGILARHDSAPRYAAALALFRAEHGAYPDKLDELVPGIFTTLPAGPFGANTFIFKPIGSGYLLYCTGPNGKDDGGSNGRLMIYHGIDVEQLGDADSEALKANPILDSDDISIRVPLPALNASPIKPSDD